MSGIHMMLMGSGGSPVDVTDHNVNASAFALAPANASASASVQFQNDGTLDWSISQSPGSNSNGTYAGEWLKYGNPADYELFATVNSGTLGSGTVGSWIGLGTSRTYSCSATRSTVGVTTQSANVNFQIRHAASGVVLDSCNIGLFAEATKEN